MPDALMLQLLWEGALLVEVLARSAAPLRHHLVAAGRFDSRYIREVAAGISAFSLIFDLGHMWTIPSGAPIFNHPTHTFSEFVAIITQAAYIAIHFTHTEIAYHRHD